MIRRPPRSTLDRSSAASDVYKRQGQPDAKVPVITGLARANKPDIDKAWEAIKDADKPVSYTHLRAHETVLDLVCRLLLEKTQNNTNYHQLFTFYSLSSSSYIAYICSY